MSFDTDILGRMLYAIFLLSLVAAIFFLRLWGRCFFIKPLFYLSDTFSADALRVERKIRLLIYACLASFSLLCFFASLQLILQGLQSSS